MKKKFFEAGSYAQHLCITFIPKIHCNFVGIPTLANKLYTGFPQQVVDKANACSLMRCLI